MAKSLSFPFHMINEMFVSTTDTMLWFVEKNDLITFISLTYFPFLLAKMIHLSLKPWFRIFSKLIFQNLCNGPKTLLKVLPDHSELLVSVSGITRTMIILCKTCRIEMSMALRCQNLLSVIFEATSWPKWPNSWSSKGRKPSSREIKASSRWLNS